VQDFWVSLTREIGRPLIEEIAGLEAANHRRAPHGARTSTIPPCLRSKIWAECAYCARRVLSTACLFSPPDTTMFRFVAPITLAAAILGWAWETTLQPDYQSPMLKARVAAGREPTAPAELTTAGEMLVNSGWVDLILKGSRQDNEPASPVETVLDALARAAMNEEARPGGTPLLAFGIESEPLVGKLVAHDCLQLLDRQQCKR